MIVSIHPAARCSNPEVPTVSPDSSIDSKVFQRALSAASSTQDAASSFTRPGGTVVHDRKAHHGAELKSPDPGPALLPAVSPSTLPQTPASTRSADPQSKIDPAQGVDGCPSAPSDPAGNRETPESAAGDRDDLPEAGKTTSLPADGVATYHEAALRDAIATIQNAGILSTGQAAGIIGTLSSFVPPGVSLKGIKAPPTAQASSGAGTVSSASSDRQHKPSASEEASNADSSGASQGNPSDQGSNKTQVAEVTLPQEGTVAAHAGPLAALAVDAVPVPVHSSGSVQSATAQLSPASAAYAMLQPEAVATPFVSSARLIQSIQQSDMRVGLNSLEFGAISIHTSTDRGVISSEITLGHAELARTISSHISAMQELAGTPQALSVRVDTSSSTAGDSSGPSQHSPGDRQQQASRNTQSRSREAQPRSEYNSPVAARIPDGLDARLDVRI